MSDDICVSILSPLLVLPLQYVYLAFRMTKHTLSSGPAAGIEIQNNTRDSGEDVVGKVDGKAQPSSAQLSSLLYDILAIT